MNEALKQLLESEVLDNNTKEAIREAWGQKLEEVRKEAVCEVREEFASRYAHDKEKLVEAVDKFLTNKLKAELDEFKEDKQELMSQKRKIAEEQIAFKRKASKVFRTKIANIDKFVTEAVTQEINEFNEDRKLLLKERRENFERLAHTKEYIAEEASTRIAKLENFIVKQLTKEIQEFRQDKQELAEQRVKMLAESKNKFNEVKDSFLERATAVVEKTIDQTLRNEMSQFKEDLKAAKQNSFGRRIFEAVAHEFMASHLSDGTQIKGAMNAIKELKSKLSESSDIIKEQQHILEATEVKKRLAEDKAIRVATLGRIMNPLNRDQKEIMSKLLESVKTERLESQFKRHLPSVLREAGNSHSRTDGVGNKQRLSETKVRPTRTVKMTGNTRNRLTESINTESEQSEDQNKEINELKKLAGLN